MRDIGRLYNFHAQLQHIHVTYFPDWRFGQLIINFQSWLKREKNIEDMFYIEEIEISNFLLEFAEKYGDKIS